MALRGLPAFWRDRTLGDEPGLIDRVVRDQRAIVIGKLAAFTKLQAAGIGLRLEGVALFARHLVAQPDRRYIGILVAELDFGFHVRKARRAQELGNGIAKCIPL